MYQYEYPRPCITADILVSYKDLVCLIRRKNDPYQDYLALPGGFFDVELDSSIMATAKRELKEETNIYILDDCAYWRKEQSWYHNLFPQKLQFKKVYDSRGRDPRARTITFVYRFKINKKQFLSAEAGDDAGQLLWRSRKDIFKKDSLIRLAFDHRQIIKECW